MRSPIDTGPPPADERSASRPGHAVGSTEEPPAGSAVGNLAWSVSGEAVRLLGSFGAFLILVRIFSPAQLGLLIAATALFAMLYPFAGLGGGWLVLQRVTKEAWTPGDALAVANGMTLVGSLVVGLLVLAARPLVMPQMPWHLFLGVGVSEMMLLGLVETTLFAAQATERLVAKAVAWSMYGVARAAAATLVVLVVDDPGLGLWILVAIGVGLAPSARSDST